MNQNPIHALGSPIFHRNFGILQDLDLFQRLHGKFFQLFFQIRLHIFLVFDPLPQFREKCFASGLSCKKAVAPIHDFLQSGSGIPTMDEYLLPFRVLGENLVLEAERLKDTVHPSAQLQIIFFPCFRIGKHTIRLQNFLHPAGRVDAVLHVGIRVVHLRQRGAGVTNLFQCSVPGNAQNLIICTSCHKNLLVYQSQIIWGDASDDATPFPHEVILRQYEKKIKETICRKTVTLSLPS